MPKSSRGKREPITEDRVYWGVVADGARTPEYLVSDRKLAELFMQALPAASRSRARIVRTYITIWVLGKERGRPLSKFPRDKNKH